MCFGVMLVLFGLMLLPVQASALGFGTLHLKSHLHASLNADIPLLRSDSDDMQYVRITLANPQEYKQLGVQWQPELSRIQVLIQDKLSDHPMLQLRSTGVIHSPMLSVLLKAKNSARGTYFRHYQLLFDLAEAPAPVVSAAPVIHLAAQVTQVAAQIEPQPVSQAAPETAQTVDKRLPAPSEHDGLWARTWRYGPVQAGDNLSEIAYRLRVDKRFSNKQVMLSLYEHNRDAFVDANINHLIKGVWLTVPRANVVERLGDDAAMQKLSKLLSRPNPNMKSAEPRVKRRLADAKGLRYSGKISLDSAEGANAIAALSAGMDQRFESIHNEMMAGTLQMTSLDQTVAGLHLSMQGVQRDIQRMQQEIDRLKQSNQQGSGSKAWLLGASDMMLAGALLLLFVLLVLFFVLKKKQQGAPSNEAESAPDQFASEPIVNGPAGLNDSEPDHSDLSHLDINPVDTRKTDTKKTEANKDISSHAVDEFDTMQNELNHVLIEESDSTAKGVAINPDLSLDRPPNVQDEPEMQLQSLVEMSNEVSRINEPDAFVPLADEVVQLLNQAESSLGQCDFEHAEKILQQITDKWPDSLKGLALKAQLYHETDRLEQRNDLINSISEASDEQRWERFCYFLPSHVWNACFGDGSASKEDQ